MGPELPKTINLVVGSISSGISDATLKELLITYGPIKSFTRDITPTCNPRAFAITEFEEPDAVLHVELPALEDGCSNKHLLIKVGEKTCTLLDVYEVRRTLKPSAEAVKADIGTIVARLQAEAKDRAEARFAPLFRYQEHICEAERTPRIQALNEAIEMLRAAAANEAQSRIDVRAKLAAWDDDESDDLFYTHRSRWRALRAIDLAAEEASPDGFVHNP
ncbi:hypothetical protein B0H13DRAFT_2316207 [Mycena leptocephala]|nr:hypothetical protein B0H13DRAFT_2316207 [Mycena leptocephala]